MLFLKSVLLATLIGSLSAYPHKQFETPKNLIMAVTDGMGGTYIQLARAYKGFKDFGEDEKTIYSKVNFSMDKYIIGQHRTRSEDSFVTDSAAGATVFASGERTTNGWIGVRPDGTNIGSIFNAAKQQQNAKIGVTVKSTVTHATPAAFYSHVKSRKSEYRIADQALLSEVDVILGGGYKKFTDRPAEYYNQCDVLYQKADLLEDFKNLDYDIVYNKKELESLKSQRGKKVLGLFADEGMSYKIDGYENGTQPDLFDMTKQGLDTISSMAREEEVPFYYHIEASLIDWAGHSNDPAGIAEEVIEWDYVWAHLMKYVDEHPDTVLLATSDHETGGMSLGKGGDYFIDPEPLTKQTASIDAIRNLVFAHDFSSDKPTKEEVLEYAYELTETYFGLNRTNLTQDETDCLYNGLKTKDYLAIGNGLSCVISGRANIGWSTTGHTGTDVNVYAYPRDHFVFDPIRGVVQNYEIGQWAAKTFGLDMLLETQRVKDIASGPTGQDLNKTEC